MNADIDLDLNADTPPQGERSMATWLLARNPWAAQIVRRALGTDPMQDSLSEYGMYWPAELASLVQTFDQWQASSQAYEDEHPAPDPFGTDEATFNRAYEAWVAAAPMPPSAISGLHGMSSGELRVVRCLAALGGPVLFEAWDLRLLDTGNDPQLRTDLLRAYLAHP